MLACIKTSTISGLEARPIDVEVRVKNKGQPRFNIIGLGDGAIRESRDRILSALKVNGFKVPSQTLINLAPAELKKEGSAFDLPIAIAILVASGQLRSKRFRSVSIHGELSLDGKVKEIRGAVAAAIAAAQRGLAQIILPRRNGTEAALIENLEVIPIASLVEAVAYLSDGGCSIEPAVAEPLFSSEPEKSMQDVWGQSGAKRAMIIAAAGGHNLLMIGPPGCGKSMLASRFPGLLPPMSEHERLEVVKIHSVAGLPISALLKGQRPFRAPHHVVSEAGLIGGGPVPRPGEISLAHHGVLFLDEFPEYRRAALEALRAPLEDGHVTVTRARATVCFPARFQLIAAMNPCPCGRLGDRQKPCMCARGAIQAYLHKLSQPILDRIDLHVEMDSVPIGVLAAGVNARQCSSEDRLSPYQQVLSAQHRQLRLRGIMNSRLSGEQLFKLVKVRKSVINLLERAAEQSGFSARGFSKVLKVALTIADLAECDEVTEAHVSEALGFRSLERLKKYCEVA